MATFIGKIKFDSFVLTHSLEGECQGSILNPQISGGTSPYTVNWSGVNSYNSTTFDVRNLCPGTYKATVTDVSGSTGVTTFGISGFTKPVIVASLTNDDCVLDPNKLGTITVKSSQTETSTYNYELYKDGKKIQKHYGSTADTTHTFTNIENGMYTLSVVENKPTTSTTSPDKTGCTSYDFNDGGNFSGYSLNRIFSKWEAWAPRAPRNMSFPTNTGPNTTANGLGVQTIYFATGLDNNGIVYTKNPYVWFYTGTTKTRLTDNSSDWYLGASALTNSDGSMQEGNNVGPNWLITSATTQVGKFYYNTIINKFIYLQNGVPGNVPYSWVTYDARNNYGPGINSGSGSRQDKTGGGNPVSTDRVINATFGTNLRPVDGDDFTVKGATNIVTRFSSFTNSTESKFATESVSNNNQHAGLVSRCSYNNYTWATSFNSTGSDDDSLGLILASFRDIDSKYGPSGVTHTLSMLLNQNGTISLRDNVANGAYGNPKYNYLTFENCHRGCTSEDESIMTSTVLINNGTRTPQSGSGNWNTQGSIRVKVERTGLLGEFFNIKMTDTMGSAASATKASGATNPFNSNYEINLNLLDRTTWSGNSKSAESWVENDWLCKYLGSRRIGVFSSSQPLCSWYHIQFSATPTENKIVAPSCRDIDGPTTTISITATTGTTTNISRNNPCNANFNCNKGVPNIRPNVKVVMQTMPLPNLDVTGVATVGTKLNSNLGGEPTLKTYNINKVGGRNMEFTFGGDNTDFIFGNAYPKFRIYPYNFQKEELHQTPVYEAIFDTLPTRINKSKQAIIMSAQTYIPFSTITTNDSWEYIIRPSYLFKDKSSLNDYWVDTDNYPTNPRVYNSDLYMVLISNPPLPNLTVDNFFFPTQAFTLQNEVFTVSGLPNITGGTGFDMNLNQSVYPAPGLNNYVYTDTPYSAATYKIFLGNSTGSLYSSPLVSVNGIVMVEGISAASTTLPHRSIDKLGDYKFTPGTMKIEFHRETVQNGDTVQVVFDAGGGLYSQRVTIPDVVSTNISQTIFEKNGYYFINFEKQALGTQAVFLNGTNLIAEQDYYRVGDTQIQLMTDTSLLRSGDTLSLFYKTIYNIISTTITKTPEIPISYSKEVRVEDEILLNLYSKNGDLVRQYKEMVSAEQVGVVTKKITMHPPAPGSYSYEVIVNRYYPLINKEVLTTSMNTERVPFSISRDVFYSPKIAVIKTQGSNPSAESGYNVGMPGY